MDDPAWFHADEAALRRRHGTKWARYGPDVLPAWIADMDFPIAPPIREALLAAIERGDVGYPTGARRSGVAGRFADRAAQRWDWELDPELVHLLPDVVRGVANALFAFSAPGDAVVVQTPVYPPFLTTIKDHGRLLVPSPVEGGVGALADVIRRHRPKVLLLCHPHNPTGHVYTVDELRQIAAVAKEQGVVIVSDEIHADLTHPGSTHVPMALLAPARTVTLTSASKAFNLAGLRCAIAVSGTPQLHDRLMTLPEEGRHGVGILGIEATMAAWTPGGDAWLEALVELVADNARYGAHRLGRLLPCSAPDATYLLWLDARGFGLRPDPATYLREHGRVALSDGADFGPGGEGFVRLNVATSRTILERICERIEVALAA